jgi:NADH:ubiquinone oxidoreductase subunit E
MLLTDTQLSSIQTPDGWVSVEAIRERAAATATPPQHIIMLRAVEDDLGRWAA